MIVPLDFLVPSLGRCKVRLDKIDESSPLMEEDDDEVEVVDVEFKSRYSEWEAASVMGGTDDDGAAILDIEGRLGYC
jgi:hypothetical protein